MNQPLSESRIALCLSGGGLRATYFHLGVIRCLRDMGLLPQVKLISAVSGGSITAAHLVKNWDAYSAFPDSDLFDRAAEELVEFGQADIRGYVLRRSPSLMLARIPILGRFYPHYESNTRVLVRRYQKFFDLPLVATTRPAVSSGKGGATAMDEPLGNGLRHDIISNAYRRKVTPPSLLLNSSSLSSGAIFSFSESRMYVVGEDGKPQAKASGHPEDEAGFFDDKLRFSYAVAASSAFPLMFSPLALTASDCPVSWEALQKAGRNREVLSDGGIYDNLGLSALQPHLEKHRIDFVLVSNAGASFNWQDAGGLSLVPGIHFAQRLVRSSDIMAMRIRVLEFDRHQQAVREKKAHRTISLSQLVPEEVPASLAARGIDPSEWNPVPTHWQQRLARVRTDLDDFPMELMGVLVAKGYVTTRHQLLDCVPEAEVAKTQRAWLPAKAISKIRWRQKQRLPSHFRSIGIDDPVQVFLEQQAKRPIGILTGPDWLSHVYQFALILAGVGVVGLAILINRMTSWYFLKQPPAVEGLWEYSFNADNVETADGLLLIERSGRLLHVHGIRTNQIKRAGGGIIETNVGRLPWKSEWVQVGEGGTLPKLAFQYVDSLTEGDGANGVCTLGLSKQAKLLTVSAPSTDTDKPLIYGEGRYVRDTATNNVGTITIVRLPPDQDRTNRAGFRREYRISLEVAREKLKKQTAQNIQSNKGNPG
jgi:predicted acylesterase/phospholipase RssA